PDLTLGGAAGAVDFDIGNVWHWLFVVCATVTSAWNACRVFFAGYEAGHILSLAPFYAFWYELAATMAGWMGLWAVLPTVMDCSGGACRMTGSAWQWLVAGLSVLAILGLVPKIVD